MAIKKIRLLIMCVLFWWVNSSQADQYTSITGMQFSIARNNDGVNIGNVVGTDLYYKDTYCSKLKAFMCINLGVLKVNIPEESFLQDEFSWLGEFGEKNSVNYIPRLKILGAEFKDVFVIEQDWSKVQKQTTYRSVFEVYFTKRKGIIAFRKKGANSEFWFTENTTGFLPN